MKSTIAPGRGDGVSSCRPVVAGWRRRTRARSSSASSPGWCPRRRRTPRAAIAVLSLHDFPARRQAVSCSEKGTLMAIKGQRREATASRGAEDAERDVQGEQGRVWADQFPRLVPRDGDGDRGRADVAPETSQLTPQAFCDRAEAAAETTRKDDSDHQAQAMRRRGKDRLRRVVPSPGGDDPLRRVSSLLPPLPGGVSSRSNAGRASSSHRKFVGLEKLRRSCSTTTRCAWRSATRLWLLGAGVRRRVSPGGPRRRRTR